MVHDLVAAISQNLVVHGNPDVQLNQGKPPPKYFLNVAGHSLSRLFMFTITNVTRQDLTALYLFLWTMIEAEWKVFCLANPEGSKWIQDIISWDADVFEEITKLPITDKRRLYAFSPFMLSHAINSVSDVHLKVATVVKALLDMSLIQRSRSSLLPVSTGTPISMRSKFKPMIRKTAITPRRPEEELEYQCWHREAAR
jgi:hypothetical protein